MLKLLADIMMFLLKAPFAVMSFVSKMFLQRTATERAVIGVKGEFRSVSKLGKFFAAVGLVLLWLLAIAFLVGVLVLLWYVNDLFNLERVLGGPWPIARPYWLPILMVLFCISCFVGYQLYRSLGPDREMIEFADLEDAWIEARSALVESGIDLTSVPIFFVLGRTASTLHALLSASRMTFVVEQVPLKANAPLQVYANRQSIYVVLPDACLLGRQAELLFESAEQKDPEVKKAAPSLVFEEPESQEAPRQEPISTEPSTLDPQLVMQNLLADPGGGGAAVMTAPGPQTDAVPWELEGRRRMPALLNRSEEVETYQRRLRYVARRVSQARAPFCPLNGVLLLVPFEAVGNDEDASQMASLCQADLQVLHDATHLSCPVIVLLTDLEKAPGYAGLSAGLDGERKLRLLGQELPLLPDLKPEEMPRMIEGSLQHFGDALTQWFFRLFRVEKSEREQAVEYIKSNAQLFELLGSIRQRTPALERILGRILCAEPPVEFLVGGYYVAATGVNPEQDQAFVPGVFQQLVQNQNAVAWTKEALEEEADYQRWTTYGYAALGLFIIAVAAIIYGRWQMLRW